MVSILINSSLMYLSILTCTVMRNTKIGLLNCNYKVDVVAFYLNTASDFCQKQIFLLFLTSNIFGMLKIHEHLRDINIYPLKCKMSLAYLYFTYPKRITFTKYNQSKRLCRFVIYLCSWLCSALKHLGFLRQIIQTNRANWDNLRYMTVSKVTQSHKKS